MGQRGQTIKGDQRGQTIALSNQRGHQRGSKGSDHSFVHLWACLPGVEHIFSLLRQAAGASDGTRMEDGVWRVERIKRRGFRDLRRFVLSFLFLFAAILSPGFGRKASMGGRGDDFPNMPPATGLGVWVREATRMSHLPPSPGFPPSQGLPPSRCALWQDKTADRSADMDGAGIEAEFRVFGVVRG